MTPFTFSVLFSISLSIISVCVVTTMISEHSTALLARLHEDDFNVTVPTTDVMNQTAAIESRISSVAVACATESSFYYSTLLRIRALNATVLNDTLSGCRDRIAALEAKIFLVSMTLTQRNSTILSSGPGFTVASILGIAYITLDAQSAPVAHNGIVTFTISSNHTCTINDVIRPLIGTQPTYFDATPSPITSYSYHCATGMLYFYISGAGTAQLLRPLSILIG